MASRWQMLKMLDRFKFLLPPNAPAHAYNLIMQNRLCKQLAKRHPSSILVLDLWNTFCRIALPRLNEVHLKISNPNFISSPSRCKSRQVLKLTKSWSCGKESAIAMMRTSKRMISFILSFGFNWTLNSTDSSCGNSDCWRRVDFQTGRIIFNAKAKIGHVK